MLIEHKDGKITTLELRQDDQTPEGDGWYMVTRRNLELGIFGPHTEDAENNLEEFIRYLDAHEWVTDCLYGRIVVVADPKQPPTPIPEGLSKYFDDEIPF